MSQYCRKPFFVSIVLISLLGLGLRFYRLSNQSFWMDEVSSVITARAPRSQIFERSADLNSLPTYFVLLRLIVGHSNKNIEVRARVISVLAGAFSVPLFIALVLQWRRDRATALIAGVLLAINPLHLWYSQETRNYALMLLFGLCCLLSFELARARQRFSWWWLGYAISGVLATSTHKAGLVFPLACSMWDLAEVARRRLQPQRMAPHWILVLIVGITLLGPSNPPLKEFWRPGSVLEIPYTGLTFLGGYSFGPSLTEIQNLGAKGAVLRHTFQTMLIVAVLLAGALICLARGRAILFNKEMLLLASGIGIVVLGGLVSNFPYNVRYALPALFGFLALIAALLRAAPPRAISKVLLLGVLVVNLWADFQWFFVPDYRKLDFRGISKWLVQNQQKIQSWTVLPGYLDSTFKWYLEGESEVLSAFGEPKYPQTTSFPPVPDILIIARRHHLLDPDQVVQSYRAAAGEVRTINSFAGFELYVRQNPETSPPGP